MMSAPQPNPWGLTPHQAAAMDAVCEHGCHKLAARALGVSVKTIEAHVQKASVRMCTRTTLSKYLAWDRWRRGLQWQSLVTDYAIACGELSKGLREDDPVWAELRALGDRIPEQAAP